MSREGDVPMMQGYPKPWYSYPEQLELLMARGMEVTDPIKALEYLERMVTTASAAIGLPFESVLSFAAHSIGKAINNQTRRSRLVFLSTISNQEQPFRMQSTCTCSIRNCDF
jgi:hypothetical protein